MIGCHIDITERKHAEEELQRFADIIEAMSSHRSYRSALGIDAALEEIELRKGTRFDTNVVDICSRLFREKKFQFLKNKIIFNEGATMADDLSTVIHTMNCVYGFDISQYDYAFLKQAIEKRCAAIETKKVSDYDIYLSNNKAEAQKLFHALNITYTEFFRNTLTYAHLEQWILPRLVGKKSGDSELRVWSAGCSSGQEAYSIAMLVEKINAKKQQALRYRIIATDISKSALAEAKKGNYTEEAIQNVRMKDIKEFFVKSGETYTVCDRLKKHISFSTYDLLDNRSAYPHESIFGSFDLVLCCNMLFYYKTDSQLYILKKLINSMEEQGYLITGEAERQTVAKHGPLLTVASPSPIFQKEPGGVR